MEEAFFRREAGRIVAVLTRMFGVHNLALAEDVAQETLARAFEAWRQSGVPEHGEALVIAAAKNRAIDVLRRERTARKFAPELTRMLESEWTMLPTVDELFAPEALRDDELRMIFSCCHPKLAHDTQVALVLNVTCGFRAREIAHAFFLNEATVEKRLVRAKAALAESKNLFELTSSDFSERLAVVHRALYLLFNEGYHGANAHETIRAELCADALRLARLLVDHPLSATPETHALVALFCLHAARLPGRADDAGNLLPLAEQDRSRWDRRLIEQGLAHFGEAARGENLTVFQLEAGIAAVHAVAKSTRETRWGDIVKHYDVLMQLEPSPVVALSRAIAIAERDGPEEGLRAIAAIEDADRLATYPFYRAALGELELRSGRREVARAHFEAARELARNDGERRALEKRIRECGH